ncbi:hypothetical protein AX15_003765 [Amanita polypyramis BW_CC]|nr:hypothetical protein AX15_003765 [Amanita polypyramis BW_CC]
MKLLNRPTMSSLKFCRVLTRSTWDGKVLSEDDLLRALQADRIWKNVTFFGKPKWIKPKHLETLPPVATVLVEIKDSKKGEDAKALLGTVVIINSQPCKCLPWVFNETIPQCQACYRWGHTQYTCCTTFLTCAHCGENHPTDSHVLYCGACLNGQNCDRITCVNCRGNGNDNHSALDSDCPFRRAQNNADRMRTLMEGYRECKAIRIEENARRREEEKKAEEAAKKKKGITVKDLRRMLDESDKSEVKRGPLGKTTARKTAAQPQRLILKPGMPAQVAAATVKKPKFGKPRTPSPGSMQVDPIVISSSPSEGHSVPKNL